MKFKNYKIMDKRSTFYGLGMIEIVLLVVVYSILKSSGVSGSSSLMFSILVAILVGVARWKLNIGHWLRIKTMPNVYMKLSYVKGDEDDSQ